MASSGAPVLLVCGVFLQPAQAIAADNSSHNTDRCRAYATVAAPATPVTIRYGLTGGGEEPLALLWADKSRYPGNGKFYRLEPTLYTANDRITAVRAGQIDAGSISLTALITATKVGIDLRAVASIVETSEIDNQGAFVALTASGLRSVAQLKGKRIGYYGPNTINEYWIRSALRRVGLSDRDVTFISVPLPGQEQALRNRQIDVAWLARQFLAGARAKGGIEVLLRPIEATRQPHPSTLVFFTQRFVKANPAAYCAWRRDYVQAMDDWTARRTSLYPKLIQAKYLTPAAANAGPDGGRAVGARINLRDVDMTIEDMVRSQFLPAAMKSPAEALVIRGFALTR